MNANATEGIGQAVTVPAIKAGKYLTFKLDAEEYGVEILKVHEIIKMQSITRVPRTPPFVRGVLNLRGRIIPVVDLRLKFRMALREDTVKTCIVVVQVVSSHATVTMGVIVDEVCEVVRISADEIAETPELGSSVDKSFILGMAKTRGAVRILLDIDRLLSADEVVELDSAGAPA